MTAATQYHKWVEWSDEDRCFVGYCPDLFHGGVCHGDEEAEVYRRLIEFVNEEVSDLEREGKSTPKPRTRPMQEVA